MGSCCTKDLKNSPDLENEFQSKSLRVRTYVPEDQKSPIEKLHELQNRLISKKGQINRAKKQFKDKATALASINEKEKAYFTALKIKRVEEFNDEIETALTDIESKISKVERGEISHEEADGVEKRTRKDVEDRETKMKMVLETEAISSKEDALQDLSDPKWADVKQFVESL
jgi:small-conductance mechanosensitive channel